MYARFYRGIVCAALAVVLLPLCAAAATSEKGAADITSPPIVLRLDTHKIYATDIVTFWRWQNGDGSASLSVALRDRVRSPDPLLLQIETGRGSTDPTDTFKVFSAGEISICSGTRARVVKYVRWPFDRMIPVYTMFAVLSGRQYVVSYVDFHRPAHLPARIATFFHRFCGM